MKKIIFNSFLIAVLLGLFFNPKYVFSASADDGAIATFDSTDGGGDMQVVLCNVLNFVTGSVGKTIASFIVIGVGIGFFTGKVSWSVLIGVSLGIASMFGAPAIIRAVTGGGSKSEWCDNAGK